PLSPSWKKSSSPNPLVQMAQRIQAVRHALDRISPNMGVSVNCSQLEQAASALFDAARNSEKPAQYSCEVTFGALSPPRGGAATLKALDVTLRIDILLDGEVARPMGLATGDPFRLMLIELDMTGTTDQPSPRMRVASWHFDRHEHSCIPC